MKTAFLIGIMTLLFGGASDRVGMPAMFAYVFLERPAARAIDDKLRRHT